MDTKQWLIDWFANHSSLNVEELKAALKEDYLKQGIIDSFAFVTLICDIDDEYDITFTNEDFLDSRFSNLEGLAAMINERK